MCIKVEIKELSEVLESLRALSAKMDQFIAIFGDVEPVAESAPMPHSPAPGPTGAAVAAAPPAPTAPANPAPVPAAVPLATAPPAPAPMPTVPTAVQTYTQDQLALAASGLIDAGRLAELQQLLAAFGAQALTQLPKEQYGAFATKLREMGAKI